MMPHRGKKWEILAIGDRPEVMAVAGRGRKCLSPMGKKKKTRRTRHDRVGARQLRFRPGKEKGRTRFLKKEAISSKITKRRTGKQ